MAESKKAKVPASYLVDNAISRLSAFNAAHQDIIDKHTTLKWDVSKARKEILSALEKLDRAFLMVQEVIDQDLKNG